MPLKLYDYWRSSAAYRVRIALNLKGASYEQASINLKPGEDGQRSEAYAKLNPQMRVPTIEVDGQASGQSMAILEWIEETMDGPSLLPSEPWGRLQCRAFADVIACDVHPLNNLSVLGALKKDFGADPAAISRWYADWIIRGFTALETMAIDWPQTPFLFGAAPTLAEICLIPQIYNARRFEVDLSAFPRLCAVETACQSVKAFVNAAPEAQPDAA